MDTSTKQKDNSLLEQLRNSRTNFEKIWGYQDLKTWIEGFYQDGKIDAKELSHMKMARSDILLDYQIAQDLIAKMDSNSPQYMAAKQLMTHLYNCYLLIDNAADKGAIYNSLNNEQKMRRESRPRHKEVLDLKLGNGLEFDLLNSLKTKNARISAEEAFYHLAMKEINPERKAQLQMRVVEAIKYMQQEQKNALQLNKVLGLQRT